MSKKLNIIEAMKMPIGTEFEIIINGKSEGLAFIKRFSADDKGKCLYWKEDRRFILRAESQITITDETIDATFIPIQQPVSFMEAITSGKKVRVDCEGYFSVDKKYYRVVEVFKNIITSNRQYGNEVVDKAMNSFIAKGKWYIEESEELDNERLSQQH